VPAPQPAAPPITIKMPEIPAPAPAPEPIAEKPKLEKPPEPEKPAEPAKPADKPWVAEKPPVEKPPVEKPPVEKEKPVAEPDKPAVDDSKAKAIYVDASARYRVGDYVTAIKLTQDMLGEPGLTPALRRNAWVVMGNSYCMLRSRPGAARAFSELGKSDREAMAKNCSSNGISLP
jgi:hypothetical protein